MNLYAFRLYIECNSDFTCFILQDRRVTSIQLHVVPSGSYCLEEILGQGTLGGEARLLRSKGGRKLHDEVQCSHHDVLNLTLQQCIRNAGDADEKSLDILRGVNGRA